MQGKGSTVDSFSEPFEFDHGSSSSNSGVDQLHYWNNMLNPVGTPNLPNILLPSSDTNVAHVNPVIQDGRSLNYWSLSGPGSSGHPLDQTSHDEAKMECEWTSSLISNPGTDMRVEERSFEPTSFLSLESVNINLNSNQVANGARFLQNSNSNDIPQNADLNAVFVGNTGQVTEAGIYPRVSKTDESETQHLPSVGCSSNSRGSVSGSVGALGETGDDRTSCLLDRRRLSCKRKSVEGVSGQSSLPGNSRYCKQAENNVRHAVSARNSAGSSLSISSPSDRLSIINSPEEPLNPRPGICSSGIASDCHLGPCVTGNAESSQRNFRMRTNSAPHHDSAQPNLLSTGNNIRHSHVWSLHQPSSSRLQPSNQTLDSRPVAASTSSQSQSHILHNPSFLRNVHPFPWNTLSNSRVGRSSSSPAISGERAATFREETNSRSMPRSISDHPMPMPATEVRHLAQNLANRNLANGNLSIPANIASTSRTGPSSGVHPALASTSVPHQSPIHYPQRLSDFVRRSLVPSAGTDTGGQSSNFPHLHPAPSQTTVLPSRVRHQRHRQLSQRSAFSMDRHGDAVVGFPLSFQTLAAAGEGRSRLVSEIRNVLDLMRRGENLRLEDILILDQSGFYGVAANLHDRHRDMRLDVDNMSYEELLALEERIGNVNTGLSEDAISKCMKVKMFLPIRIREAPDAEPCCICQEEYIEGVDIGTLDCGHDFHTGCIKQWLMLKNSCPICKTAAFSE